MASSDLRERVVKAVAEGAYLADTLIPVLKRNDTVILDNLAVHKVAGVREAIQAADVWLLSLPPYSPDFNPIDPSTGSG